MTEFDVVIIGAGAAGLFCAGQAGQRGLKVLLIDHAEKVAEKIRISGGGRCNFTNRDLDPRAPHKYFVGNNPQFCRSALSRYTPTDFIALLEKYGVPFHEKHKGQLFADRSAEDIIHVLLSECAEGKVERWQPCSVMRIEYLASKNTSTADLISDFRYQIHTNKGAVSCHNLVIATGGLSIPKIGATDFGYRLAQQMDIPVVAQRPGLVPLTFHGEAWAPYVALAGLALPVRIATHHSDGSPASAKKTTVTFDEDLLFTHRGLSGPAILQISSYWENSTPLRINLAPAVDVQKMLSDAKRHSRKQVGNALAGVIPSRLAEAWAGQHSDWQRPINEASDKSLTRLAEQLADWQITPSGTEGYKKAEVTLGGVDTQALSQKTMECKNQPGLYFIGEVVDVTGWLGGYNFQWAWSSAYACAHSLEAMQPG